MQDKAGGGLWALRAHLRLAWALSREETILRHMAGLSAGRIIMGIMVVSESPRAQTLVSGLFFAFLVILLPYQGLVLPKSNNPFSPDSLRHHHDHCFS